MHLHQQVWKSFQQHKFSSLVVKISLAAVFALACMGATFGANVTHAHAQPVGQSAPVQSSAPENPNYNVFPYPACTWWANERYHQIHGIYVPWRTNAEAWEWTARAYDFGWHVSTQPSLGSIIDLQPWVEGAYGGGHVAYVEKVLGNGHVIASNTSWGADPYEVTYVEFTPGPGVTFISQ